MHVLLTNDDGPPGENAPYIQYFYEALKKYTDWDISVAVPSVQRSWIGKAHLVGVDVSPNFLYYTSSGSFEGPYDEPQEGRRNDEWVLLNTTPASCASIGIGHMFKEKGPVDLVISGPNYGRNTSTVYMLSSGTVGASMESATLGVKSVSFSFAFYEKGVHYPEQITEASRLSIKLLNHLLQNWDSEVGVYTVNVPLVSSLGDSTKIQYCPVLDNTWKGTFKESKDENGKLIYRWSPDFKGYGETVAKSEPGNDAWCLDHEMITVSPLKAAFQEVPRVTGEIKLSESIPVKKPEKNVCAITIPSDSYVYSVWQKVLNDRLKGHVSIVDQYDKGKLPKDTKLFHYSEYDDLDFEKLATNDPNYLGCSYIYRKALIRKHFLSYTIRVFCSKHPESILTRAYPESFHIEVDYAEFLDDALDEAYELRSEIESEGDQVWILKPSMSDRAQGIRLFKTVNQLQQIFDEWEEENPEVGDNETEQECGNDENYGIVTSQLRHFVVQRYIQYPLLLPQHGNRKFHIRTYVLCVGAIKVYVYRDMLALFALNRYQPPVTDPTTGKVYLDGHLTNTCLQGDDKDDGSVERFWELKGISYEAKTNIFDQICRVTGDVFKAATGNDRINFQPLPGAFEFYGLDFMVHGIDNSVSLLEVNSYPDFKQTGEDLKELINGLFDSATVKAVLPFFDMPSASTTDLKLVLDTNTSGGW